jgi:hypothetical protein
VDHVLALHDGGEDCLETNAEALCNQCHATKTLRERVRWDKRRAAAIVKAKQESALLKPPRGNTPLLDSEPGPEFLTSRFLKYAFVKTKTR